MKDSQKGKSEQSFITGARRAQIIEAAIETLDEIGYVKASLAQIAKKAGISTALISYHFADKSDLMNHLLMNLLEGSTTYVLENVHQKNTPYDKINTFIIASLEYQAAHPARNTALIEIIFNARTPDNIPYYKLDSDGDEDPTMNELQLILRDGQEKGEFGAFNIKVMANMIQGAIGEYMFQADTANSVDFQTYKRELINIVHKALKK